MKEVHLGRDELMVEAYKRTHSVSEVCKLFGVSYWTVHSMLAREGLVRSRKKTEPDARQAAMIEMYNSGKTLQEVGQHFGITRERVRQIMRMFHSPSRTTAKERALVNVDDITRAAVVELYERGMGLDKISRNIESGKSVVKHIIAEDGLAMSYDDRTRRRTQLDLIVDLHSQGKNTTEIAAELGRSQSGVHALLKRHGFITPAPRLERTYISPEAKDQMIRMKKSGKKAHEIAKAVGVDVLAVDRFLRRNKIKARK